MTPPNATVPQYHGLFEAHITIQPIQGPQSIVFQNLCKDLKVKPIQIELPEGDVPVQPMTCSTHKGDYSDVRQEVYALAWELARGGFEVTRVKIEAAPFNDDIPQNKAEAAQHSAQNYFEHH
ncbi:MAG: hypothetical protein AAF570_19255, partial [Bacteroidota bacterium]